MIKLVSNRESTVKENMFDNLEWCSEVRIATAFLTNGGYYMLSEGLLDFITRGGRIRVLVGLENGVTDYNSILEFATMTGDCKCKLYIDTSAQEISFHPKVYIFSSNSLNRIIIGSSNLTRSGLSTNVEANVLIDEEKCNREIANQVLAYFEYLWNSSSALPVEENDELLERYRIMSHHLKNRYRVVAGEISRLTESKGLRLSDSLIESGYSVSIDDAFKDVRFAYILGLICGKGIIQAKENRLKITLQNRLSADKQIHGVNVSLDTHESHKYAIDVISEIMKSTYDSLGEEVSIERSTTKSGSGIKTDLSVIFKPESKLLRMIVDAFKGETHFHRYKIPREIREASQEVKRSFMRGYADVASLISKGTQAYGTGKYRLYINVYGRNEDLFGELVEVLEDIGVTPSLHDRHKTAAYDSREMQIRVYPEEYKIIGYNVAWKKRLLYDFIRANESM